MKDSYFVYMALCLIGLGVRTTYEILKNNGEVDTKNRAIFIAVFVAMVLMLASWILMCPLDPWRIYYHIAVRIIGLALLIVGLGLAAGGFIQLRGLENIDHLVTNGLYSKIRHPMYTGFILWIIGWLLFYGAVMSTIIGIVCVGNILYWSNLEEGQLANSYGETYLTYRKKTLFSEQGRGRL